ESLTGEGLGARPANGYRLAGVGLRVAQHLVAGDTTGPGGSSAGIARCALRRSCGLVAFWSISTSTSTASAEDQCRRGGDSGYTHSCCCASFVVHLVFPDCPDRRGRLTAPINMATPYGRKGAQLTLLLLDCYRVV